MFRNNKPLLFAALGFTSGAVGSLLGEFILRDHSTRVAIEVISILAIWSAILGASIAAGLFVASEIYHRRRGYLTMQMLRYLGSGVVGGAIAGATTQLVFGAGGKMPMLEILVFQVLCWGLMGVILGWRLAATIPNLQPMRAAAAGGIGGIIGGAAFNFAAAYLSESIGRMVGIGTLGMALGLAIVIADSLFREAALEIVWAPREVTMVALGARMVTIGGGEDDIYVYNLAPRTAGVLIDQGKIQYVDLGTSHRTDLRDGSRIKIGTIEIVVHAYR